MRSHLLIPFILAVLLLPLFSLKADLTADSLVENMELTAASNTLNVTVTSAVKLPVALRNPQISLKINIISWTEVNGTEHAVNITKSYSWYADTDGWVKSLTFDELRPDSSAVAIHGYAIVNIITEEGQIFYNVNGSQYSTIWEDRGSYWLANVHDNSNTLVGVYSYGKADKTQEFTLNFENANITLIGSQTNLPSSWEPQEGCGAPTIPKIGGFSVTYYALNPEGAGSVLSDVAEQIKADSHNLSWIESFEIKPPYDFDSLASSKNKSISELVPVDFTLGALSGKVVIIEIPGGSIDIGANAVEYYGYIFIDGAASKEVLLHEIGHAAGFCDPDPYAQWRNYWNSLVLPETSAFTNETWYTKISGVKIWASLISDPICPASRTTQLIFKLRSSENIDADWSLEATAGNVDPQAGSVTITPDGVTIETIYQPPALTDLTSVHVTLTLTSGGESRFFDFPLLITPSDSYVTTTNDTVTNSDYNLSDLADLYGNISTQIANLDSQTYESEKSMEYATRAQMNFQKAQEDLKRAMQINNSCVRDLLRRAADYRVMAAQYWWKAANLSESNLIAVFESAIDTLSGSNAVKMAEAYEKKAVSFELQANLGCPSGILSGSTGLSPLVAFYSLLTGGEQSGAFTTYIMWFFIILGVILTIVGFITAIATKGKKWGLLVAGIILIFAGIGIWVFTGFSGSPLGWILGLGGG